jgi:hypothetical protein
MLSWETSLRRDVRTIALVLALLGLIGFAGAAHALNKVTADAEIKKFLASQTTPTEGADAGGSIIADLNGDGTDEIVLVWSTMGPTYSHDWLTVLTASSDGYRVAASTDLTGQAQLSAVKGGVIYVEQHVLAKSDPLCCPSVVKRVGYRWRGTKIKQIK